jgi:hypothetical protein
MRQIMRDHAPAELFLYRLDGTVTRSGLAPGVAGETFPPRMRPPTSRHRALGSALGSRSAGRLRGQTERAVVLVRTI